MDLKCSVSQTRGSNVIAARSIKELLTNDTLSTNTDGRRLKPNQLMIKTLLNDINTCENS